MSVSTLSFSSPDRQRLIEAAISAKDGSYSPYSKFRVGAALLSADGQIIKGANIENASYGATVCAERTALVKAISEGTKDFVALVVTSDVDDIISPCGICRQFIRELCAFDMPILLVPSGYDPDSVDDRVIETTIDALLPLGYGPAHVDSSRASGGKGK
ncbi:cytidine deaminase [Peniophora sp. CONT]|nr:cytidine deaminase [Peniophora sp. CONT]